MHIRYIQRHVAFFLCALYASVANARLFDSLLSYRHGTGAINSDTSTYQTLVEPDAPDSLDDLFGYTTTSNSDGMIQLVHCYSMRNGLYGSPSEARIIWSKVDPDASAYADAYRSGAASHEHLVSLPIENQIKQFAVYDSDLSVFLMTQPSKLMTLTLHIVPGPTVADRPVRSFEFKGL